jgi:hypothetical protein
MTHEYGGCVFRLSYNECMLGRLMLWAGDGMNRFDKKQPTANVVLQFGTTWAAGTLLAHFAHLYAGDARIRHLPWGSALGAGFGLACVAMAVIYVGHWRRG